MSIIQFNEYHDEVARKRLLDIAESRTTSLATIAEIISENLSESIEQTTRIVRGESNEVYAIKTNGKQEVILRIGHWNNKTFERELWAVEQAAAQGVPTPKIISIGEHASTYYCLQEKLQGTTLDTLLYSQNLPKERAKAIVENAGEILGKLHKIETTGWGCLDAPTHGEYDVLEGKYIKAEAERERIAEAIQQSGVLVPDIEIVLQTLKSGLQVYLGHQRLIHGDFGPKHIFVDEQDNITGIIDWEQAESGDPVAEFARWYFWFEKSSPTEWLREGHERITPLDDNYEERFRVAKLEMAIWTLMYFTYNSPVDDCAIRAAQAIAEATT